MPRLDTRLESEGAEFLVLGHLLLEKISAYKTYTNLPGYDLVAVDPACGSAARIQVKSRWRTGAPGFLISNLACDFVVFCRLNRGEKTRPGEVRAPEYYVFPIAVIQSVHRSDSWGKVRLRDIPQVDRYRDAWSQIREFLRAPPAHPSLR